MKLKNIDRIFIGIIIAEMIITFLSSFYIVQWPNSCVPNVFNPLGGGKICAQTVTRGLSPLFYLSLDLLIVTVVGYVVLKMVGLKHFNKKKSKRKKRKKKK